MPFTNAQNTSIYGGTFAEVHGHSYSYNVQGDLLINHLEAGLSTLFDSTTPGASFNSRERSPPAKCHPGTREELLGRITHWVVDRADEDKLSRILWLHGPAGAGKSAIAQSIAEDCAERKLLAASFFFCRGREGRDSIDRVFTTIAYQLAMSIPNSRFPIQRALSRDPSIVHQDISAQCQKLIVEPLHSVLSTFGDVSSVSNSIPSLVILDGLDECSGKDNQNQILKHILVLAKSIPLCFLVVSRPEYNIRHAFKKTELSQFSTREISLYGDFHSREDIRTYFLQEFKRIHSSDTHEPWMATVKWPWPSTPTLDLLVERSDGYFIYASTLVRFVDQEFISPVAQLSILTNPSPDGAFGELDKLYHQVLSTIPDVSVLKKVLGAVFAEVPSKAIPELFHLEAGQVLMTLRGLQAVIIVNEDDYIPYPVHASFSNFIFDPIRSGKFYISPPNADFWAALTRAMLESLRHLSQTFEESHLIDTSDDALLVAYYTYRNWFAHFQRAGRDQDALAAEIKAMNLSCWVPLPPAAEFLPLLDERFHNLKTMCARGLGMLLKLREEIKIALPYRHDLIRYFALIAKMAFRRLFSPSCLQDLWIVHAFTTLEMDTHFTAECFDVLIEKLLVLQRPLPYRTLEIYEFCNALVSPFINTIYSLRDYLASKDAPPELLLDARISHANLAHGCLTLLSCDVDTVFSTKSNQEYKYARLFWDEHLMHALHGDERLLQHLRSSNPQYLFDINYFSAMITHVEHLQDTGIHIAPKIDCRICKVGKEVTDKEHDQTLAKLGEFNFALRFPSEVGGIRMLVLEDDISKAQTVIWWLKGHPQPPEDLILRWKGYLKVLHAALAAVRDLRDPADGNKCRLRAYESEEDSNDLLLRAAKRPRI